MFDVFASAWLALRLIYLSNHQQPFAIAFLMAMPALDPSDDDTFPARHAADESSPELLPLVERTFDAVLLIDPADRRVTYANRAATQLVGRKRGELQEMPLDELLAFHPPVEFARIASLLARGESADDGLNASLRSAENDPRGFEVRFCRLTYRARPVVGIILRSSHADRDEISSQRHFSDPHRDPLTGLADRSYALSRLDELLARHRAGAQRFALLFIDLDNFKQVNDSCGHLVGDRVLKEVADRLAQSVRAGDHIARYGGDEFVMLLEGLSREDEIKPVIARIQAALSAPVQLPDGQTRLTVSIGVARPSERHHTAEDLLAEADRAMYDAKRGPS